MDIITKVRTYLEQIHIDAQTRDAQQLLNKAVHNGCGIPSTDKAILDDITANEEQTDQRAMQLYSLLRILPEGRGKTALICKYLYDIPYKHTAVDLGISERQMMRDVNRAMTQLADHIPETNK